MPMSDNDKTPRVLDADIPPSWGFHLLQELHRMEDKLEAKIDTTNARIDTTNARIDALDTKFDQKIDAFDAKFTQRIDNLQYWYWATLAVIIVGFVTVLLVHP